MSEKKGSHTKLIAGAISVISGAVGIYVFLNDEIQARLFPDQQVATRSDIKEQFQLSEERIATVVAASVADAIGKAQARGDEVSQDEQVQYEAALTKLLTSDDPALNDAKFLAVSGDAEAAAENIVTSAGAPAEANDTVPAKSRAELLRSAGDILVPSDAAKALAAYEKALELDPDNQVLQTRIQKLKAATAAKNEVKAIPRASFEFGGLQFEFQGCDQPETPRCVFSVMNPTPDPINLRLDRQWGVDEFGRWTEGNRKKILANSNDYWTVPSLETTQIEITYRRAVNIYQLLRFRFSVDGVEYKKEFRDIAVRGGKQVEIKTMRPVDPAHPEYAYEVNGLKVHFLGCSNPDAPICRFDMMNTGSDDVNVNVVGGATGYTSQGIRVTAAKSELSMEGRNETNAPQGVAFTWEVSYNREAEMFQSFWPQLKLDYDLYEREFRNVMIGDTPPAVRTPRYDQAASPDDVFDVGPLKFVFLGCRNPVNPTCTFDIENPTDEGVRFNIYRPKATLADGSSVNANSSVLEMKPSGDVYFPAGLTTTYEASFRQEMAHIDTLRVETSVDHDRYASELTDITVEE
jgi:tetratricopeptide (TPR) repeat protein